MVHMSPEMKSRVSSVLWLAKTIFHVGFIPSVLYLGFKKGADEGMPELTVMSLLWQ
uniref:Mitochondrial import receptor subunit TOM7 homolog n=1 Tax=Octopus bimaculoides TaxID=37653 RepID=A0A0L8HFR1_OCTBM